MLLPADLRDWVPEDDLVHFVIEAVRTLPTGQLTVQAMKPGAAEFLTKPFREQELLDAIHGAIDSDRASRLRRAQLVDLRRQYESLTPREREVMARVVRGMPNKQNAGAIGTARKKP